MTLRPFISYYGGKWRAAPRYPKPRHRVIIEPFAGAAGYSLRHYRHDVRLVEKYAVLAEMWRYLIAAPSSEIRSIPCVDHVDDLPAWIPEGGRILVGFAMNAATVSPRKSLSAGKRRLRAAGRNLEGWSQERRERVASQVGYIRHWGVIEGDYTVAPNVEATWFIDPPYQVAGTHYVYGSDNIDFTALGDWCRTRRGQVIACESDGAKWLPFRPFETVKSFGAGGKIQESGEVIWTNSCGRQVPMWPCGSESCSTCGVADAGL